jgi:hypothetical protein
MQIAMKAYTDRPMVPGAWREILRLVLASLATGAVVSIVLALAVFMVATEAHAAAPATSAAAPATPAAAPAALAAPVTAPV